MGKQIEQNPELRSSGIGGSDAAVILGLSKFKTPLDLALEKLGKKEQFKGNKYTKAGKKLEDVIADWYADETGAKIARANHTFRLEEYPFIMGHIDRRVLNENKVLECKNANQYTLDKWGEDRTDNVPEDYFIQVQHYLMFPNFEIADLAVLIGGNDFRIYNINPDKELQDMILKAEIEFWNILNKGELPEPINTADTKQLWYKDNGQSVYASEDVIEFCNQLKEVKKSEKDLKKKIDELKTNIQKEMKESTILLNASGTKLYTWKLQNLSGFNEALFKAQHLDIYEQCLTPTLDKKILKNDYPELFDTFKLKGRVFR